MGISQNQEAKVGIKVGAGGDFNDINNNDEKNVERKYRKIASRFLRISLLKLRWGIYNTERRSILGPIIEREKDSYKKDWISSLAQLNGWILQNDTVEVRHVLRQASDYSMIIMDSKPRRDRT